MTVYDEEAGVPAAALVPPVSVEQPVGAVVAAAGLTRLCVAEAKKYGHLCYFFNGHRDTPFDPALERYVKVRSLPGRDENHPAMATAAVVERVLDAVHGRDGPTPDLLCINLANGDMCGHTGVLDAAVAGMEAVDAAVSRLLAAVVGAGGGGLANVSAAVLHLLGLEAPDGYLPSVLVKANKGV
ncbi:hypothetical protein MMPV_007233 [Pyropia vietnamensis]